MNHPFKIFPAHLNSEGQKVPLIKGWYENASNDPNQIKLWQQLFGHRITFWGVPTGSINGIFALDVDVKKANGFNKLKELGFEIPPTLMQYTPSGGAHFLFRTEPGANYPNSVNSELGLDTRGDRGWIAYYGFGNEIPLAAAPDWLFKLKPSRHLEVANAGSQVIARVDPVIAESRIKEALDAIRNAPEGESNNVLNREAFAVGQLVRSGSISYEFAYEQLFLAAKARGKPDYEAKATITSGLHGGAEKAPLDPFNAVQPTPQFDIPPAPEPPRRWTPELISRADLMNTSALKKPQLFEDWSTLDISVTTADGGTGKTTLALYEAVCMALGERFLGFQCKQPGKTLFITGEDTEPKLKAMLGAICRQMGLFEEAVGNFEKVQIILDSIRIKKDADLCLIIKDRATGFLHPNADAARKVLEAVVDFQPARIVFDPIASFWGGEQSPNDTAKALTKFASELVERANCQVDFINHMGKDSSRNKDMSQFAGRGGSALPSHARVSRALRSVFDDEFLEMTGKPLGENESAILCNVNKFSDGSPLYNKPFLILRTGYLFSTVQISKVKEKELFDSVSDAERVMQFIKECRAKEKFPSQKVVVGHFASGGDPISKARTERALTQIQFHGHIGESIRLIDNPDQSVGGKVFVIVDLEGKEI